MNPLPDSKLRWKAPLTPSVAKLPDRMAAVFGASSSVQSRLQRRLNTSLQRDRLFFKQIRRKRARRKNQPSRLSQRLQAKQSLRGYRYGLVSVVLALGLASVTWGGLFVNEQVTLGGVPYRIVQKFWNDKPARDAYFAGDREALHAHLQTLGIERDIKDYYRDRFDNEHALDRHIHQIMFNRTGYVGQAYAVDNYGQLNSRPY